MAELMRGKVEEVVKGPPSLTPADYPAVITKFAYESFKGKDKDTGGEKEFNKLRLTTRLLGFPADGSVDEAEQARIGDITTRYVSCDYWLPPERRFALLLQQCGISGEIHEGTPGELIGKHVLATVKNRVNKDELISYADSLTGADF